MSALSARVMKMTPRELETGEWRIIASSLAEAQRKFVGFGIGAQEWLEPVITIATKRSMPLISEQSADDRAQEDADWREVRQALIAAKRKFSDCGFGNQSWMDSAIGIALR